MNRLLKLAALLGLAGVAYPAASSPPAGNYIANVSTISAKPAINISSATVRDQLKLTYISTGSVLAVNSLGVVVSTTITSTSGSGGGSPPLQVTRSGVEITSPTASINFGTQFSLSAVGSTSTVALNSDLVVSTLTAGNIYLNTSNPLQSLDIRNGSGYLETWGTTGNDYGHLGLTASGVYITGGTNKSIRLGGNGNTADLVVSSNSTVGIGNITTPTETLDVNGNVRIRGTYLKFPDGTTQATAASGTGFIQNTSTLQSGATFYVSSGTIAGSLNVNNDVIYDPTTFTLQVGTNTTGTTLMSGAGIRAWGKTSSSPSPLISANPFNTPYIPFASEIGVGSGLSFPNTASFQVRHSTNGEVAFTNSFNISSQGAYSFKGLSGAPNYFSMSSSSQGAAGPFYVSNLNSGECVQTTTGGQLTTTGAACGSGSGGSGIVSPGTFTWTNNGFGVAVSTLVAGSATSTSYGNNSYVTINSSGTSQNLTLNINGQPSGGVQNKVGGLTINALGPGGPPIDMLVLYSSYTSAQGGSAMLSLWQDNPLRNDPMIWLHRVNSDSSPEMRWDGPSPNMEMVMNSGLNNAIGEGKWEPFAIAAGSRHLQCGSNRANNNGTFENLCELYPLYSATEQPGMYLHSQTLADDSGILSSSGTSGINFFTVNAHTVGLTAAPNTTASWMNAMPDGIGAQGNVMYHGGTVTNGPFTSRQWKWTGSDMNYSTVSGLSVSTLTVTSSATFTNVTISGTCTGSGCGTGGGGGASPLETLFGTVRSSPTATLRGDTSQFLGAVTGSTMTISLNSSSVTLQGNNLSATYLTNSSATATYLNTNNAFTQTLADARYGQLAATQTWTGQNAWTSAQPSTFTALSATGFTATDSTSTNFTASKYVFPSQGNTRVLFMNGNQLATTSVFTWNGTTMSATNVSASGNANSFGGTNFIGNVNISSGVLLTGAAGTNGQVFTSGGPGTVPTWTTLTSAALASTQTWTGQETWASPQPSTFTYGVTVGSLTVTSASAGNLTLTQNGFVGQVVISTAGTGVTPGHIAVWGSSMSIVDGGAGGGGSTPGGVLGNVQYNNPAGTLAGASDFNIWASSVVAGPTYDTYVSTLIYTTISNSTSPIKTANYTMVPQDSVIYASAPANTNTLVVTLPSASLTVNQTIQIFKADISTRAIQIQAAGTDLIGGTTGSFYLYSQGQGLELKSNGAGKWFFSGVKPVSVPWLGVTGDPNSASVVAANNAYCFSFYSPDFEHVRNLAWENGAAAGNYDIGLYDNAPNGTGNLLGSLGSTTTPAAGIHLVDFTSKNIVLAPGIYWYCIGSTSATTSINRYGSSSALFGTCQFATSIPLPASFTWAGCTVGGTREYAVTVGVNGGPLQ